MIEYYAGAKIRSPIGQRFRNLADFGQVGLRQRESAAGFGVFWSGLALRAPFSRGFEAVCLGTRQSFLGDPGRVVDEGPSGGAWGGG